MKIAICDDFDYLRRKLINNIKEYHGLNDIEIDEFEDGKYLLDEFEMGKYDLIFLDYYMKQLKGVETANRIREIDQKVMIVFATNEDFYFSKDTASLRVNKPMSKDEFDKVMEIYKKRKEYPADLYFEFAENGRKRCLFTKHIVYIRDKEICLGKERVITDEPVTISEKDSFFTTKSGFQINVGQIRSISWNKLLLLNKEQIKIGWRERKPIQELLELYDKKYGMIRLC